MVNESKITRKEKFIFLYLRCSLLIGPFIICSFFVFGFIPYEPSIFGKTIQKIIFLFTAPGYFILPGVMKAVIDGKKLSFFELQLFIGFTILTLGIGPSVIFFLKYDPMLKKLIENNGR
ncbi:MAG: hypothetical protein GY857_17580 [Desulfobacula sp.]|nr:hypothetical protein [Desulfobacula sp.]